MCAFETGTRRYTACSDTNRLMRALFAMLATSTVAYAQPVATSVEPEPRERPAAPAAPTTAVPAPLDEPDWTSAPSPAEASGVAHEDARPRTDRLLWIPRALLFLPRMAVWLLAQPVRGAAYAYERYDMKTQAVASGAADYHFHDIPTTAPLPVSGELITSCFRSSARLCLS